MKKQMQMDLCQDNVMLNKLREYKKIEIFLVLDVAKCNNVRGPDIEKNEIKCLLYILLF